MARKGQARREERKAERFAKLESFAINKFEAFDTLNKDIDAKVSKGMGKAEKLQVASRRGMASQLKKARIIRETFVVMDALGTGSAKGMWNPDGSKNARGKEKAYKVSKAPVRKG